MDTHSNGFEGGQRSRSWIHYLIFAAAAVVVIFSLLDRLDQYPIPWYDEGSHLHVAKNYVLNGIYSDYSSEGLRPFGPTIGVGPTVLLPIALVFKLFGVSIPLARLVIVAYALAALVMFYLLTSRYLNFPSTMITLALIFFSPGIDFIFHARTVLGEVPGLFFLCAGLWLWLRPGTASYGRLLLVGVFTGLACITKNQFALVILPAMLLNWIADLFWYRRRGWRYFVIPGIVAGVLFGFWTYIVIIKLGQGDSFSENLATLRTASAGAFFVFSRASLERAVRFLVDSSVYSALFVPAFIYGLFLSLRRDEEGQLYGMLMMFIITGTGLFIASLAWPRYAFGTLCLTAIFAVKLIHDFTNGLRFSWSEIRASLRGEKPTLPVLITILAFSWIMISIILPIYTQLHKVSDHGSTAAYELADWLKENVPADALIETWEPELGVVSDNNFHFPPQIVLAKSVAAQWENGPPASDAYDFRDYVDPDYIIIGTFDKYTDVYLIERIGDYEKIKSIGDYDVFARRKPVGP